MSTAFRIGVFVLLALAALFAGVFLIGSKDFLFSSTYRLKTAFPNVGGLNPGADVRIGGIHEGTVKEIDLPTQPEAKVTVVMSLRRSTRNSIKKDSVASIKTQGLLGDQFVEISFGSPKAEPVRNGDTIAGEIPKDISEQVRAIADQVQAGAASFHDDMEALQQNFLLRGYFNNRGYNDEKELTQHSISRLPSGPHAKEFDYDATQIFEKEDDAKLKDKKLLGEVGHYLENNQFGLAVVVSSESKGDTAKDHILSEARAKVARDYLVENFNIDDTRLKTLGRGKIRGTDESSKLAILIYPAKLATQTTRRESP